MSLPGMIIVVSPSSKQDDKFAAETRYVVNLSLSNATNPLYRQKPPSDHTGQALAPGRPASWILLHLFRFRGAFSWRGASVAWMPWL